MTLNIEVYENTPILKSLYVLNLSEIVQPLNYERYYGLMKTDTQKL